MRDDAMNDDKMNNEPLEPVDPKLRAALRSAFGSAEDQVNWDAMAARIADAAVFRLAQRRPRGGWQHTAARWSRRAVPLAAAAAVMLALGIALAPEGPTDAALANDTVRLEEVMAVAASDGLPTDLAVGSAQDAFLAVMLNGED